MISIEKRLKGVIPYRVVWFPTAAELMSLSTALPITHVARVDCAESAVADTRCMIEHHLSVTLCIDLLRPLDNIFGGFDATARKKVRRAERFGSRVAIRRYADDCANADAIDEFVALFNELAQRKPGAVFPLSRGLVASFFPHAELFMIDLDDKLVLGRLAMCDRESGRVRQLYGASRRFEDPEAARLAATLNVYLQWYELQAYREAGFATYDLGGISPVDDPGINRFKLQFGGEVVRYHSYFFAGMPHLWRAAFELFSMFSGRGRRRRAVERAGDKWQDMPLDRIRELIGEA